MSHFGCRHQWSVSALIGSGPAYLLADLAVTYGGQQTSCIISSIIISPVTRLRSCGLRLSLPVCGSNAAPPLLVWYTGSKLHFVRMGASLEASAVQNVPLSPCAPGARTRRTPSPTAAVLLIVPIVSSIQALDSSLCSLFNRGDRQASLSERLVPHCAVSIQDCPRLHLAATSAGT